MLKSLLWRVPAGILAALYWAAAASLGFALTGQDPLDSVSDAGTGAGIVGNAVILAAAVVVFALVARAWYRRMEGRDHA